MSNQKFFAARRSIEARNEYLEEYLPLARSVAHKYGRPEEFEDMYQECSEALLTAFDRFKPLAGKTFGQYSRFWMRSRLQDWVWRQTIVKITRAQFLSGDSIPKRHTDEDFDLENIALDEITEEEEIERERVARIHAALKRFTKKERLYIEMYFGIGRPSMTYTQMGKVLGLTKQRVHQVVRETLRKISIEVGGNRH